MAKSTPYESLVIKINADISSATKGLESVASSVQKLQKNLNKVSFEKFKEFADGLNRIKRVDLSKLASQMATISNGYKVAMSSNLSKINSKSVAQSPAVNPQVGAIEKATNQKPEADPRIKKLLEKVNDFAVAGNNLKEATKSYSGLSDLRKTFDNLKLAFVEEYKMTKENTDAFKQISESLRIKGNALGDTKGAGGGLAKSLSELLGGGFDKFIKGIGNKLLSRGIFEIARGILTTTISIAKMVAKSLYQASSIQGGAFAKVMDDLASSWQFFVDSLAVLFEPFIEFIVPILSGLLDVCAYLINAIGVLVQAILGTQNKTTAEKTGKAFGEGANKTLGIDELNVIGNNQSGLSLQNDIEDGNAITQIVQSVMDFIVKAVEFISNVILSLDPAVSSVGMILVIIADVVDLIMDICDALFTLIPIKPLLWGLAVVIKYLGNALLVVITFVERLIGGLLDVIGGVLSANPSKVSSGGEKLKSAFSSEGYKNIDWSIPEYATGGFPEDGFFMANHNELVGSFNGKTAVANNNEITQGIYQAVLEAMNNSDKAGANVAVYLDSKQIASKVEDRINNKGLSMVGGKNLSYAK